MQREHVEELGIDRKVGIKLDFGAVDKLTVGHKNEEMAVSMTLAGRKKKLHLGSTTNVDGVDARL